MKRRRMLTLAATLAIVTTACTDGNGPTARYPAAPDDEANREPTLTVYSRERDVAEPLFDQFERQTGIKVRTRWGDPVDLAEQIIEDGTDSPADVFYAPMSDALGALSAAGRLAKLSDQQLSRVPQAYRSPDGTWVGTTSRAHVVFYNTDKLSEDDLPDSILGFADPAWRGRIAWDPTSRSLQDAVTGLHQINGEDTARTWLDGIQANEPAAFRGARPVVDAVAAGEIADVGFGSHYYLYDMQADGDATNVAAKFYPGNPAGLLNVAGIGILNDTDNKPAASALVDFMLSKTAQRVYTYEIPLVKGTTPPKGIPTADELTIPGLDQRMLEELGDARRLLTDAGVLE
ncbi:MAG: extracellular solute-binding protein [Streptosporangiales bacterium]|nr:extracellular solute-binding protein [Streptosporangiales bacterium]